MNALPQQTDTTPEVTLKVTRYDRVSSLLVAALIEVGFFVAILFCFWLTTGDFDIRLPGPDVEQVASGGNEVQGQGESLEEPGNEELSEFAEPELQEILSSVSDLISTKAAALDAMEGAGGPGKGPGGDPRLRGPEQDGQDIVPRWDRWRIRYDMNSLKIYSRQLDHFQIELAAAGGGYKNVDYAKKLSQPKPESYSRAGDKEKRLYFTWNNKKMREFDRTLLRRADIVTNRRVLLQFYPKSVENELALLERAWAKGKEVGEIESTTFAIRDADGGYEFYVASMKFREQP